MSKHTLSKLQIPFLILLVTLFLSGYSSLQSPHQVASGFSEYYIPAEADQLWSIFLDNDNDPALVVADGLHYVVAVTSSTDNTTIYYDHWENGYGFDPMTFTGADESFAASEGSVLRFESSDVPVAPRGTGMNVCTSTHPPGATGTNFCYDGRDRIYVVGGVATVTLGVWPDSIGTVYAFAWELYPTKPYQTNYIIPVGEDLVVPPFNYDDFDNVYVLVQATTDDTAVQIDDPQTAGIEVDILDLDKGEVTELWHIGAGTIITASLPVQSQFIVGQGHSGNSSETRGYTSVPSTLWNNEYYAPVYGAVGNGTDLYLYNPNATSIDITWQDSTGTGSITLPAGETRAYSDSPPNGAGHGVPSNSAVQLNSASTFWGIGSVDTEGVDYDWNFSLIPSSALTTEYFLGWSPGNNRIPPTNNCSPVWVTATADDTTVQVDYSPTDGTFDQTVTIDRLDVLRVYDPDLDNTGMRIVATAPIAVAWGEADVDQIGDPCSVNNPNMDLGYTVLPQLDEFIDIVLDIDKTVSPTIIPDEAGQIVTFTLVTTTESYPVTGVDVEDLLPAPWDYIDDSTTITYPDTTVVSGNAADPLIVGQVLTWDLSLDMNPNETLIIEFSAISTAPPGTTTINQATATGSYNGQTFTTKDSATVGLPSAPTAISLETFRTGGTASLFPILGSVILLLSLALILFSLSRKRSER